MERLPLLSPPLPRRLLLLPPPLRSTRACAQMAGKLFFDELVSSNELFIASHGETKLVLRVTDVNMVLEDDGSARRSNSCPSRPFGRCTFFPPIAAHALGATRHNQTHAVTSGSSTMWSHGETTAGISARAASRCNDQMAPAPLARMRHRALQPAANALMGRRISCVADGGVAPHCFRGIVTPQTRVYVAGSTSFYAHRGAVEGLRLLSPTVRPSVPPRNCINVLTSDGEEFPVGRQLLRP